MLYDILMRVTVHRTMLVEADSPEEAQNKAEKFDVIEEGHDEDIIDWEVENIRESES